MQAGAGSGPAARASAAPVLWAKMAWPEIERHGPNPTTDGDPAAGHD